jgi:hypothetical protein
MFDLARASVLSVILFLATGFAATTPNSRITISFQAVHASQGGGIYDRGGRRSTAGERSMGYIRRSVPASGLHRIEAGKLTLEDVEYAEKLRSILRLQSSPAQGSFERKAFISRSTSASFDLKT